MTAISMVQLFDPRRHHGFQPVNLSDIRPGEAGSVAWIDLQAPSAAEIQAVGERFGFHPLAIEDAHKRRQRPKIEIYPNHLFFVIHALESDAGSLDPTARELAIFAADGIVVIVHVDDLDALRIAQIRWAEHCRDDRRATAGMLVYTISDAVVDGYFPVMDSLADAIDAVEERMFDGVGLRNLEEIFTLKRSLLTLRQTVAPTREVFNAFTRRELAVLGEESLIYYQDIYDHLIRATEAIDTYREVLSSAIDIYLSLQSNDLNQTVRTLTVASIVLMSMTLIAGVYGMNFEHMPELTWRYGYFLALAAMLVVGLALAWALRRLNWW